jgi:hypothetical protein
VKTYKREREKRVKDKLKYEYFSRVSYYFSFPVDNNSKGLFKFCVLAHRPTMLYSAVYNTGGLLHGAESYFNEYQSAGDKICQRVQRSLNSTRDLVESISHRF